MKIMIFYKMILLSLLCFSLMACQMAQPALTSKPTIEPPEGRKFYLFKAGYQCRENTPERTKRFSWVKILEFKDGMIFEYGNICDDVVVILENPITDFQFSSDLSSLIYQSEKYLYFPQEPIFSPNGEVQPR